MKNNSDNIKRILREKWSINAIEVKLIPKGFFQMSYSVKTNIGKYFLKLLDPSRHIVSSNEIVNKLFHYKYISEKLNFVPRSIQTTDKSDFLVEDDKFYVLQEYLDIKNVDDVPAEKVLPLLIQLHDLIPLNKNSISENFNNDITEIRYKQTRTFVQDLIPSAEIFTDDYLKLIDQRLNKYLHLRKIINKKDLHYVHKDPFGNVVETNKGFFMIDWDDITISNIEADLWFLIDRPRMIKAYEKKSSRKVNIPECQYYAIESFFLYYSAYARKYSGLVTSEDKKNLIKEIKTGMFDWFESVYSHFKN